MLRTSMQAINSAGNKSAGRKRAGKSIKSLSGIKHAQKKFLKIKQNRTSACIKQEFNKIQDSIMQE
jgi:hypothetical protein